MTPLVVGPDTAACEALCEQLIAVAQEMERESEAAGDAAHAAFYRNAIDVLRGIADRHGEVVA